MYLSALVAFIFSAFLCAVIEKSISFKYKSKYKKTKTIFPSMYNVLWILISSYFLIRIMNYIYLYNFNIYQMNIKFYTVNILILLCFIFSIKPFLHGWVFWREDNIKIFSILGSKEFHFIDVVSVTNNNNDTYTVLLKDEFSFEVNGLRIGSSIFFRDIFEWFSIYNEIGVSEEETVH